MSVKKFTLMACGVMLIPIGCITMISPIPGGSLVMPTGIAILIYHSPFFRRCIQRLRSKIPFFDHSMSWLENRTGNWLGAVLKTTQPIRSADDQ